MSTAFSGFSGVRTTGIYCRDGCPASPLQKNVTRYATGVAAEAAGFRPCLRCRPDRLPFLTSNSDDGIVGRAILLIAEGALDNATEDDLARELGLTGRHLRRIFNERIGATPSFVAQSRRAHFARRLLDETDLRVTDIAYAAGFNSVRQMNRVVFETFRHTPTDLRSKRRDRDRLVADGGISLRLPYRGALDFDAMLAYLAARAIPGVESIDVATGVYRRTITTCGNPGAIEIRDGGDGAHLVLTAHLSTIRSLIDDVARTRRIFGLDATPAGDSPLASDPILASLAKAHPGLRVPGAWDPFEVAVRVIVGQQVSVRHATQLAGKLASAFGERVPGLEAMSLTHIFPTATALAAITPAKVVRAAGMPAPRAQAIVAFARAYAAGDLRLEPGRPLDDLVSDLVAVPGVGPWTAQMIAMRACAHPDAFAAGDLGLRRALQSRAGEGPLPQPQHLETIADRWRPNRALAAILLWSA